MTTPGPVDVDRKIRQLDNDVQSIYEILEGIAGTQVRHGNRLGEIDARLTGIGATQARHGNRLDEIDARTEAIADVQAHHGDRLSKMDVKLGEVDAKLDTIITVLQRGE